LAALSRNVPRSGKTALLAPGLPEPSRAPFASLEDWVSPDLEIPDPLEFVLSSDYLRRRIYPRQGTLLKLIFLRDDLLTEYDYEVIRVWGRSFASGEGQITGIQPDILERLEICKAEGRPWFREVIFVGGRRGSKSFLGALAGAYVLWHYLTLGDPQGHFGIDRSKQLGVYVFANQEQQAMANQWKDLRDVIIGAKCFIPWVPRSPKVEILQVFAPNDDARVRELMDLGITLKPEEMSSFVVAPMGSAAVSARGPAACMDFFDEFALVTRATSKSSSEDLWQAATPALDQFRKWAFIYMGSSPYQMTGQFYAEYEEALARSDGTDGVDEGTILRPEVMMTQLTSWDIYEDWQIADEIPIYPDRAETYPHQVSAPQEYDEQMRRLERANPATFMVERRAQWAAVQDAYFSTEVVDSIFEPWPPPPGTPVNLGMLSHGPMMYTYTAHADPSDSDANFGFALAHTLDLGGLMPHVVFDLITHWSPQEFPDGHIDYAIVLDDIKNIVRGFAPDQMSFDQGYSAWMISELKKWSTWERLVRPTTFFKRSATAPLNWTVAEVTKTACGLGYVHAPTYDLLAQEMKFLQKTMNQGALYGRVDHPTSGPVTTKDVWDCVSNVVYSLIGDKVAALVGESLMAVGIRGGALGGLPLTPYPRNLNSETPQNPIHDALAQLSARRTGNTNMQSYRPTNRSGRNIGPRSSMVARPRR
jgi:hypothetical protein